MLVLLKAIKKNIFHLHTNRHTGTPSCFVAVARRRCYDHSPGAHDRCSSGALGDRCCGPSARPDDSPRNTPTVLLTASDALHPILRCIKCRKAVVIYRCLTPISFHSELYDMSCSVQVRLHPCACHNLLTFKQRGKGKCAK